MDSRQHPQRMWRFVVDESECGGGGGSPVTAYRTKQALTFTWGKHEVYSRKLGQLPRAPDTGAPKVNSVHSSRGTMSAHAPCAEPPAAAGPPVLAAGCCCCCCCLNAASLILHARRPHPYCCSCCHSYPVCPAPSPATLPPATRVRTWPSPTVYLPTQPSACSRSDNRTCVQYVAAHGDPWCFSCPRNRAQPAAQAWLLLGLELCNGPTATHVGPT